jgi:hypothetical protein
MEESETFWEPKEGEELVPTVNPADVHAAWQLYRDAEHRRPGEQVAIEANLFRHTCSPGADISSVTYRTTNLLLLFHVAHNVPNLPDAEKLLNWESDRELEPRLFEVMSKIPLKWLPKEGTHNGLPVDVSDFIRQVEKAG